MHRATESRLAYSDQHVSIPSSKLVETSIMSIRRLCLLGLIALFFDSAGSSIAASPLFSHVYTSIPAPQKVSLGTKDFEFTRAWRLELGAGIKPDDIAVQSLKEQLQERFELTLGGSGSAAGVVHLAVAPNAVAIGPATDSNKSALAEQAYRMELASNRVAITGNTTTGLFYGVQTLVQLLKPENGKLRLPEGQIEDWPDLELRVIYWDDAHHLEHLDVLKAALRQASFTKSTGSRSSWKAIFNTNTRQP